MKLLLVNDAVLQTAVLSTPPESKTPNPTSDCKFSVIASSTTY